MAVEIVIRKTETSSDEQGKTYIIKLPNENIELSEAEYELMSSILSFRSSVVVFREKMKRLQERIQERLQLHQTKLKTDLYAIFHKYYPD